MAVLFYFFVRSHPVAKESPFFTLLLCGGAGLVTAAVGYGIPRLGALFAPHNKTIRLVPWVLLVGAAVAWATFIARLGIRHHTYLGTAAWDFGLYINSVWHSLHGEPLGCSLVVEGTHASRHFDPILVLLSPILLLRPGAEAESLMIFQCAWVASGVVPLYLLTTRLRQSTWVGVALVATYLLHPALHGPAIFEFHSLTIAGPLMIWCMYFLEANAPWRFLLSLCLLLLCREDMAVLALSIGVYALIAKKSSRMALMSLVIPLVYGALVYFAVFSHAVSYSHYFSDMKAGSRTVVTNIVLTAVSNPVYMLKHMLDEEKIVYILKLIVPLLFVPLFASKHRVLLLFGLAMTLTGSIVSLFRIGMPYSTWWLPFMFAGLPVAIERAATSRLCSFFKLDTTNLRGALIMAILVSSFVTSSAYGIFWPNPMFRVGYVELVRFPDDERTASAETVAKIVKMIPSDASVMATEHMVPHFSTRDKIWSTDKVGYQYTEPDYAIIWEEDLSPQPKKKKRMEIRHTNLKMIRDSGNYDLVLGEHGVSLYKRKMNR